MASVRLRDGLSVPALGQGTWHMGEDRRKRSAEVAAIRLGVTLGLTLIDTAEMYGAGEAERIVAEAIAGARGDVFLVSKVLPQNATRAGVIAACEGSLRRLKTDHVELYLLHWRGTHPIAETIAGFERLREQGKIRAWGVSNFDAADMAELERIKGGTGCACDQVLYNLGERGIEFDLLPWCEGHGMPVMAYTPLGQGRLLGSSALKKIAERHGASAATVAIAFLLARPGIIVIPKGTAPEHVRQNAAATSLNLDVDDLAVLDAAFPPPTKKKPLAML